MNNDTTTSHPPIETMIGQMLMVGFQGSTPEQIEPTLELIKKGIIGGVILYNEKITVRPPAPHNIRSPQQVKTLTTCLRRAAPVPLLIAVDQEGGLVNRLKQEYGFPPTPAWAEIGVESDPLKTLQFSQNIAIELQNLGINLNLAPVLDLGANPESFIVKRQRCFSGDPELVSRHAEIFIQGHRKFNILTAGKHFPGQGSTKGDTHEGLVDVSATWSEEELKPYEHLIKNNSLFCIMTSHIFNRKLDPEYPATLSRKILTGLLRETMEFKGVIISDDPQMKALADHYSLEEILECMIHAGVDLFCFGNNLTYVPDIAKKAQKIILHLIQTGHISQKRISTSYQRIMKLKGMLVS